MIVGVHGQLDALQAHPVVGHLQYRLQQATANTFALPGWRHTHADTATVGTADTRVLLQRATADDFALVQRHQKQHPFVVQAQSLAPYLR
ncbi:hypothetical protein D3C72_2274020 [compost metagenome]